MSEEMLDLTDAEREELIEALQYPTKWHDKGMPTEQVVERATDGHEAAHVVDEYLLPVISRILAARCAELEAGIVKLRDGMHEFIRGNWPASPTPVEVYSALAALTPEGEETCVDG